MCDFMHTYFFALRDRWGRFWWNDISGVVSCQRGETGVKSERRDPTELWRNYAFHPSPRSSVIIWIYKEDAWKRRDQEQEGKGDACAAEDKRGKSAKTLQGYNPPQGFLPLHCIATRLEICPFLTQVQFNERVTQREYDNYSNPRTVCQQPNRRQDFLYFECIYKSV